MVSKGRSSSMVNAVKGKKKNKQEGQEMQKEVDSHLQTKVLLIMIATAVLIPKNSIFFIKRYTFWYGSCLAARRCFNHFNQ